MHHDNRHSLLTCFSFYHRFQITIILIKNIASVLERMTSTLFRLQSNKFTDNIQATLVCSRCAEVFSKEFPLDLEGQTIEFKYLVCSSARETDLPYKSPEERDNLELDLDLVEDEEENSGEEFEESY